MALDIDYSDIAQRSSSRDSKSAQLFRDECNCARASPPRWLPNLATAPIVCTVVRRGVHERGHSLQNYYSRYETRYRGIIVNGYLNRQNC